MSGNSYGSSDLSCLWAKDIPVAVNSSCERGDITVLYLPHNFKRALIVRKVSYFLIPSYNLHPLRCPLEPQLNMIFVPYSSSSGI